MHPVVSKASRLILVGDVSSAEQALVEIAETEGDHALVRVLDDMPPKDLVSILRQFDSSRESVVNMLVTPEQFAAAIVLEKRFGERTRDRLHGMINAIVHGHTDDAERYLTELTATPAGISTLGDYFEAHLEEFFCFALYGTFTDENFPDLPEESSYLLHLIKETEQVDADFFFDTRGNSPLVRRAEIADGNWMETAWVLRYEVTEGFEHVFHDLRDRVVKRMEALAVPAAADHAPGADASGGQEESAI